MDGLKKSWSNEPYNEHFTERQAWWPTFASILSAALIVGALVLTTPSEDSIEHPKATYDLTHK